MTEATTQLRDTNLELASLDETSSTITHNWGYVQPSIVKGITEGRITGLQALLAWSRANGGMPIPVDRNPDNRHPLLANMLGLNDRLTKRLSEALPTNAGSHITIETSNGRVVVNMFDTQIDGQIANGTPHITENVIWSIFTCKDTVNNCLAEKTGSCRGCPILQNVLDHPVGEESALVLQESEKCPIGSIMQVPTRPERPLM